MKVCAMIDKSAGNDSVGDMWTETKSFDDSATLADVLSWAEMVRSTSTGVYYNYQRNVKLAILQEDAE